MRVITHIHSHTHTVKVRSTLCGYVVLKRVNDSKNNVLKTVELLFERKWVRDLFHHTSCITTVQCWEQDMGMGPGNEGPQGRLQINH